MTKKTKNTNFYCMVTEDKVTEIYCLADDFCKYFDSIVEKYAIDTTNTIKRKCHRDNRLSSAEVMLIVIMFHASGFRCLKHFYLEYVSVHCKNLFPRLVSYNRFVELQKEVAVPLTIFIKRVLLGKCTGISFVDSTPLRVCKNQRILVADKGYISKNLFQRLFVDGIQLITKLKNNMKGALMSVSDKVLLRHRAIIETVNDELKNIAQVEHSRHRSFDNFVVNLLGGIAAYCFFPKKPCINIVKTIDNQLSLF